MCEHRGRPVAAQAGLRAAQVETRDARLSVASQIEFLEGSADALDDPLLGFHLAQDFELREQARECFSIARQCRDEEIARQLVEMGNTLMEAAHELSEIMEKRSRSDSG